MGLPSQTCMKKTWQRLVVNEYEYRLLLDLK